LLLEAWTPVTLGALMHDIGKVFVGARLLGKPAPVTHETVLGIVRRHRERWDGGGYPDGLEGPATPLGARILERAIRQAESPHQVA
jgi:response regulator RpfG family c-di-GMP phosphodiesterase